MESAGLGSAYAALTGFGFQAGRGDVRSASTLPPHGARNATGKVRGGETLLLSWGYRKAPYGVEPRAHLGAYDSAARHDKEPALELTAVRVKLIAAGFVDTRLEAAILGGQLNARVRNKYDPAHSTRRRPADSTALAVHVITNTAFDIDGGQQLAGRASPLIRRSLRGPPPCNAEPAAPHRGSTLGDRQRELYSLARGDRKARADSSPSRASRRRASPATRRRSCLRREQA